MTGHPTQWLANIQRQKTAALRLFCFPYAGGSTSAFHNWQQFLPEGVEVYPVQLPGRGLRLSEAPPGKMDVLVAELASALGQFMDCESVFFGHSMGALIAFELVRKLRREGLRLPVRLFVSGREAPQVPDKGHIRHDLPDSEFVSLIRSLNGTPTEILDNDEMRSLVLPILRADFRLVQQYEYCPDAPLMLPIKAYGGLMDRHASKSGLELWSQHTTAGFSVSMLRGGHFFFQEYKQQFMRTFASDVVDTMQLTKSAARFARV